LHRTRPATPAVDLSDEPITLDQVLDRVALRVLAAMLTG
jgi:hypothetical protein